MEKILITKDGKKFYAKDSTKDVHTQYGFVKSESLTSKDGSILKTNTGKEVSIFSPKFIDFYEKIKRGAQIIPLKDVGQIITFTGLCSDWKIIDGGSGSGALACFLANLVPNGKVFTYDIREDHLKTAQKNIDYLGLKNVKAQLQNVYKTIPEKNADLITLDLPEPWEAAKNAKKALKVGGFLVAYTPTTSQLADFVNKLPEGMVHLKSIEIIEREWEVKDRKVRPKTASIGHSGFLTFVRRIN
ncbi:methyltransferase domain-containing protein [Candidatus Woesearchaeota archaeon]|nr:methyltransferase domain-containing protein [Candidatus Woesearchaeota archaeon]